MGLTGLKSGRQELHSFLEVLRENIRSCLLQLLQTAPTLACGPFCVQSCNGRLHLSHTTFSLVLTLPPTPTWIIFPSQGHLISNLTPFCNLNFPLLCNITCSLVPGIKRWTPLGGHPSACAHAVGVSGQSIDSVHHNSRRKLWLKITGLASVDSFPSWL